MTSPRDFSTQFPDQFQKLSAFRNLKLSIIFYLFFKIFNRVSLSYIYRGEKTQQQQQKSVSYTLYKIRCPSYVQYIHLAPNTGQSFTSCGCIFRAPLGKKRGGVGAGGGKYECLLSPIPALPRLKPTLPT